MDQPPGHTLVSTARACGTLVPSVPMVSSHQPQAHPTDKNHAILPE